jgi:flagellar assembly factor FliW
MKTRAMAGIAKNVPAIFYITPSGFDFSCPIYFYNHFIPSGLVIDQIAISVFKGTSLTDVGYFLINPLFIIPDYALEISEFELHL